MQESASSAAAPPAEQLQCPRCKSTNTKFCYYNNYNLAQPRHFCKDCRRYWTKGGSLRDIPVGGATRRATKRSTAAASNPPKRRPSPPSPPPTAIAPLATATTDPAAFYPAASPPPGDDHDDYRLLDFSRSLCSLLGTDGTFAQLLDNCFQPGNPTPADAAASTHRTLADLADTTRQQQSSGECNVNTSCWSNTDSGGAGGRQWPDLTIYTDYTPLFKFQ